MYPPPSPLPPLQPWQIFLRDFARGFDQGEHVVLCAQNGWGKTFLADSLVEQLGTMGLWSVYLWTKPRDKEIEKFLKRLHYKIFTKPPFDFTRPPGKFAIKAEAKSLASLRISQETLYREALDVVWNTGKLALILDELRYLDKILGLGNPISVLFLQARSSKVSLIAGTQRPRWIPVEALTEAKHFFIGHLGDLQDRKRLAEVLPRRVIDASLKLQPHEFIYANISGVITRVKAG